MRELDEVTWQVLTLTLTLLGLLATVLLWRRRGAASGLRALAWALLPAAAYLTGTLRLLWRVADAVVDWATRLVLSPTVWVGIALAGLAALLFVVSGVLRRRAPRTARSGSTAPEQPPAGQLPGRRGPAAAQKDDDFADVEDILRKHGIS